MRPNTPNSYTIGPMPGPDSFFAEEVAHFDIALVAKLDAIHIALKLSQSVNFVYAVDWVALNTEISDLMRAVKGHLHDRTTKLLYFIETVAGPASRNIDVGMTEIGKAHLRAEQMMDESQARFFLKLRAMGV